MTVVAAVAFVAAVAAALAQALTGFGSAMVVVPILTIVLGPQTAVVSATGLSMVVSVYAMVRHRQHVAWRPMLTISVAALVGMPVGLLVLLWLSKRTLTVLIGLVLLAFTALLVRAVHLPRHRAAQATVGLLSGALLTSTGVNGPPVVAAFHAMRLPPVTFRATLLATLCVQDAVAVCAFGALGQLTRVALVVVAAGLPGLALGWLVGDRVFARFRDGQFRWAVLVMMTLSACLAIGQAIGRP